MGGSPGTADPVVATSRVATALLIWMRRLVLTDEERGHGKLVICSVQPK